MNFLNKMERKYGRYAIRNLTAVMIALYAAGYILTLFASDLMGYLTLEPYYILRGQIWRIVTWILVPPSSFDIFTIVMLFFYFSIGQTLEKTWGSFRYNVYILSGLLFTVIGAFILYGVCVLQGHHYTFGLLFNTYYINMSIFLAFAVTYPDMEVLLYFIIPVKMKWMGVLYGVLTLYSFVSTNWAGRAAIIASLLNFILFFILTRNHKGSFKAGAQQRRRREQFRQDVKKVTPTRSGSVHKCAVCGRTEKDGDDLVFRYCSQCRGGYEYCQDHLFTHMHK